MEGALTRRNGIPVLEGLLGPGLWQLCTPDALGHACSKQILVWSNIKSTSLVFSWYMVVDDIHISDVMM